MTTFEEPLPPDLWEFMLGDPIVAAPIEDADMTPDARYAASPEFLLSERERNILCLVAHGYSNIQISLELNLAEKTVRNQVCGIYASLGVSTRVLAVRWALRAGLASLSPSPVERSW